MNHYGISRPTPDGKDVEWYRGYVVSYDNRWSTDANTAWSTIDFGAAIEVLNLLAETSRKRMTVAKLPPLTR